MKRAGSVLDTLVASVNLIVLQYLLACAELSFWKHPLFILFFACDIYLIACYLESLKRSSPLRGCVICSAASVSQSLSSG